MNFMLPSALGVGVAFLASRRHSRSDSSAEPDSTHRTEATESAVNAPAPELKKSGSDKRTEQEEEPAADKEMNAEKIKAGGGDGSGEGPSAAESTETTKKVIIRIDPELEASAMEKKVSAYREQIVKNIVSAGAIKVTLEGFPYYMR